jgi:hypothetical protein
LRDLAIRSILNNNAIKLVGCRHYTIIKKHFLLTITNLITHTVHYRYLKESSIRSIKVTPTKDAIDKSQCQRGKYKRTNMEDVNKTDTVVHINCTRLDTWRNENILQKVRKHTRFEEQRPCAGDDYSILL